MKAFVFAAGSYYGLPERPAEGDWIAAADAGYTACRAAGFRPDLVVGDFDSSTEPAGETVLRLPVEKDDTDTLHALRLGLERGCRDFVIYGGTGGARPDHTLANLQCLLFLAAHGARGRLYGDGIVWRALSRERMDFPAAARGTLSLFCMGGEARGVTLRGLKYNMELMQSDPDLYAASGPALLGVFEVSVTGSHIDRFYGSYWWD